jgi:hypothetical protein
MLKTSEIFATMDCIPGDNDGEVTMSELVWYYTPVLGQRECDIKAATAIGKRNAIQMVASILELDSKTDGKSVFSDSRGDVTISKDDLAQLVERTPPRYATQLYVRKTNGDSEYNLDRSLKLTEYGHTVYKEAAAFVNMQLPEPTGDLHATQ